MLMPVLLAMFIFISIFFGYILPSVENNLMDRKREMNHALSGAAMSSLIYFSNLADNKVISLNEAKDRAAEHLRNTLYGLGKKLFLDQRYPLHHDHALLSA
jgi:hypothetical protein